MSLVVDQCEAEGLIEDLKQPVAVRTPSAAFRKFSQKALRLPPEVLLRSADELLEAGERADEVAQVVCDVLRAVARDLEEHGKQSENAGSAAVVRKGLKTWEKRCTPPAPSGFLGRMMQFDHGLEESVVAFAEKFAERADKPAWSRLRNASSAVRAAADFAKKPCSPWLMEMFAAFVGSELVNIKIRERKVELEKEAPALLAAYVAATEKNGRPAFFGARVEQWARDLGLEPPSRAPATPALAKTRTAKAPKAKPKTLAKRPTSRKARS